MPQYLPCGSAFDTSLIDVCLSPQVCNAQKTPFETLVLLMRVLGSTSLADIHWSMSERMPNSSGDGPLGDEKTLQKASRTTPRSSKLLQLRRLSYYPTLVAPPPPHKSPNGPEDVTK
eukprot:1284744-Amphidinium_carterae.1